jgi:MFS transporter, PAT family, beta-lactamase induction signal transducer AmpG
MTTATAVQANVSPFRIFGQRKMAALLLLGFASGLPLFLTSRTLQAWMTKEGVDLATIGLFSLVALPYSLKFFWAPIVDRFIPPFLGRRRGWLVITQVSLLIAIAAMALHDPRTGLQMLAVNAVLIAFLSASQDIVGDAYRTDVLEEREMGAGATTWVLGYRIALITAGTLAFVLADYIDWPIVYVLMGLLMVVGMVTAFWAPEPVLRDAPPQSLYQAVVLPFVEFFKRTGLALGLALLIFITIYRYPDGLSKNMSTPFLLHLGFSQTEIGIVLGGIGLGATIVGVILGGLLVSWIGLNRSLWAVAVLGAITNLVYYWLALAGKNSAIMLSAVVIENIADGIGAAVLLGLLMSLCEKKFSATQFALLSSLIGVSRDVLVAPAGRFAENLGWPMFWVVTVLAILPAMIMLPWVAPWNGLHPRGAAAHTGETQ